MESVFLMGKIGCFPLVTYERAVRRSENRLLGEQVIKPITSITRDVRLLSKMDLTFGLFGNHPILQILTF